MSVITMHLYFKQLKSFSHFYDRTNENPTPASLKKATTPCLDDHVFTDE